MGGPTIGAGGHYREIDPPPTVALPLARWTAIVQNYGITTHYVSGNQQLSDCLSRME